MADDIIARLTRLGEDIECDGDDTCTICAAMQEIRQLRDRADELAALEEMVRWYLESLDETRRPCDGSEAADIALDLYKAEKMLRGAVIDPGAPKLAQVIHDLKRRVGLIEQFTLSTAMQQAVKR